MNALPSGSQPIIGSVTEAVISTASPVKHYLSLLSPTGMRAMTWCLKDVAEVLSAGQLDAWSLPWHQLRQEHVQALRKALVERHAPATANQQLAAVRGVLKACWRLRQMTHEDYQRAVDVPPVRYHREMTGRSLSRQQLTDLVTYLAAIDTPAARRDEALLAVAFTAGLRVAELSALDLVDVDLETSRVHVREGKGNKERTTYLAPAARRVVARWLEVRGTEHGPLFLAALKGGRLTDRRMAAVSINQRFHRLATVTGIPDFTPHDARRTWIGNLMDEGIDAMVVQRLAGHSSVATTARYDRRPEEGKRQAVERLYWPEASSNNQ